MNTNSAIYMGDDGHYHDKPADELEQAPEPIEEGDLEGVQDPGDGTAAGGEGGTADEPKQATAKTRKQ